MQVWGQKSRVDASMGLNVTYINKQVFLGMNLETSKYNIGPRGSKSLQRDKEGHKCVNNHAGKISCNTSVLNVLWTVSLTFNAKW